MTSCGGETMDVRAGDSHSTRVDDEGADTTGETLEESVDANCRKDQRLHPERLKFGIDAILSAEYPASCYTGQRGVLESEPFYSRCNNPFHYCCQFDHSISASSHFYPSLYISTSTLLPTVRKYGNFVIEADRDISGTSGSKRKRIWSRAVFSKLQRKGLEKRFQLQKYIMKPDRKQLATSLGLTDAQVKVWFQNRRMKWRNRKENSSNRNTTSEASNS